MSATRFDGSERVKHYMAEHHVNTLTALRACFTCLSCFDTGEVFRWLSVPEGFYPCPYGCQKKGA